MERWVVYAFVSMAFAGFTSVIAKQGLHGISADLGLAIRTVFVFVFILSFAGIVVGRADLRLLQPRNVAWLAGSAATTALSWIFYYKAIKAGNVSTVALIDKGSVVVAVLMAWLLLGEALTPRLLTGAGLIVAGLVVIALK